MKKETSVVNKRKHEFDVYIGRGSIWGNPFKLASKSERRKVINDFEKWIRNKPELLKQLHTLKGKRLGCFCKPMPCHGDVLVKLIEYMDEDGCFGFYNDGDDDCEKCPVSDECFKEGVV